MIDLLENIKGILIFCSGADRETLTETKLSSEENKYVTIGALIILTTVLASVSGGTSAHKFFGGNVLVTALVAVFWGSFIFFLERYFMMSTKKFQVDDDLWGIIKTYFSPFVVPVVIRISFSIILSLLIAFPLEAQIFHSSIKVQISKEDKEFAEKLRIKDKIGDKDDERFKYVNEIIDSLEAKRKYQIKLLEKAKDDLQAELDTGAGEIFIARKRLLDEADEKIKKVELEIQQQQREKELIASKPNPETEKIIAIRNQQFENNTFGIEREISALNKLVEENKDMRDWHDLIRRVLILIEVAPISLKILSPFSAYDAVLQSKEKRAIMMQAKYDENFQASLKNEDIQADLEEKAKIWREHERKLRILEKEVLDTAIASNRLKNRKRRLAAKRARNIQEKNVRLTQIQIDLYNDRGDSGKPSRVRQTIAASWYRFLRLFGW